MRALATAKWRSKVLVLAAGCFVAFALSLSAELRPPPDIGLQSNWKVSVLPGIFDRVDNLVFDENQNIYATLERKKNGEVIHIDGGETRSVLTGLNNPDGLRLWDGSLYITEESSNGRLLRYDLSSGKSVVISSLGRMEGIEIGPEGSLIVSQDKPDGRLLQIDPTGRINTLAAKLERPEGVAVGGDGSVYVAETGSGRILRVSRGVKDVFVDGLTKPDQIEFGPHGALWITEDRNPGRLLRYIDGRLEVIARSLNDPQGIAFDAAGKVYVAEQGQNRILIFERI